MEPPWPLYYGGYTGVWSPHGRYIGGGDKFGCVTLVQTAQAWNLTRYCSVLQDRVYPELQKLIAKADSQSLSIGKETRWEKSVAKAATIRDICKQRPYQHGADMLAAITQVLDEYTKPDQATPAALVLQGLHALCQAEVLDIRSTWKALSPKLESDKRPLVLKALHEFFSLVPSLVVKTEDYEKFKVDILSILWSHTQTKVRYAFGF
ncbi:unnamed protein product [Ranitomeya imitator]|uniref:DUF3730 domain-containing protein n=1 Tax=Ranitomeya imitator TaxID=111125 RepID=A0ABN9MGH3_9NEOB|nr:unnamed protein product [Ranitomeya imitator]